MMTEVFNLVDALETSKNNYMYYGRQIKLVEVSNKQEELVRYKAELVNTRKQTFALIKKLNEQVELLEHWEDLLNKESN